MFKIPAAAAIAVIIANAASAAETLRILNWVDYLAPEIIEQFQTETGIEVVVDTYSSTEQAEAMLLAARTGGVDVAVAYSQQIRRLINGRMIQSLDLTLLPNISGVDQTITGPIDPAVDQFAAPYLWSTTGVGYNVDMVQSRLPDGAVDSWAMVFDPELLTKLQDCGVMVIDNPETVVGGAMSWLGIDPSKPTLEDIDRAFAVIDAARPFWTTIESETIDPLSSGKVCVTMAWSTEVMLAIDIAQEGVSLDYIIPTEGSEIALDNLVISSGASNVAGAHKFIDFMMRPEIIALATNAAFAANAIPASTSHVDGEILNDPKIYPTDADRGQLYTLAQNPALVQASINDRWMMTRIGL